MWVGGCVTAPVGWVSGPSALASRGGVVGETYLLGPRLQWVSGPSALASRGPWGPRCRGTRGPARPCGRPWGRRSVHRLAKMAPRRRFGPFVYTVAPWAWVVGGLGITIVYTNGRIGPLLTGLGRLCTLLGCCAVVDRCEDAIVYTDRRKWPLGAVLGHLCTLLRRESRYESRRELHQVAQAPQPPWRAGCTPSLAPPAWSGR